MATGNNPILGNLGMAHHLGKPERIARERSRYALGIRGITDKDLDGRSAQGPC
jgi:hypothetical protein